MLYGADEGCGTIQFLIMKKISSNAGKIRADILPLGRSRSAIYANDNLVFLTALLKCIALFRSQHTFEIMCSCCYGLVKPSNYKFKQLKTMKHFLLDVRKIISKKTNNYLFKVAHI